MLQAIKLVKIMNHGHDHALYIGNDLILVADPDNNQSTDDLDAAAIKLASALKIELKIIEFSPDGDWNWDEVTENLKSQGELPFSNIDIFESALKKSAFIKIGDVFYRVFSYEPNDKVLHYINEDTGNECSDDLSELYNDIESIELFSIAKIITTPK
jgi:hypothetical protein